MKSSDRQPQPKSSTPHSRQPFFGQSKTAFFSPDRSPSEPFFNTASASSALPIQAKLTVGAAGDKYEQEADRVASEVVDHINNPSVQPERDRPSVQRMGEEEDELQMKRSPDSIQRMGEEEEELQRAPIAETIQRMGEEEEELQMKPMVQRVGAEGGSVSANLEGEINSARGGGQSLAPQLRAQMSQAMGADFSGVRVHTDERSDQLNQSIQAKAFTTGQDVFFRQGEYNPRSRGGQELIAHELTHVVQQSGLGKPQLPKNQQTINPKVTRELSPTMLVVQRAVPPQGGGTVKEKAVTVYQARGGKDIAFNKEVHKRKKFSFGDYTREAVFKLHNPSYVGGRIINVRVNSGSQENVEGVQLDHQISWDVIAETMHAYNQKLGSGWTATNGYTLWDAKMYYNDIPNLVPALGALNASAGEKGVPTYPKIHHGIEQYLGITQNAWMNLQQGITAVGHGMSDEAAVEIAGLLAGVSTNMWAITDRLL